MKSLNDLRKQNMLSSSEAIKRLTELKVYHANITINKFLNILLG